MESDYSVRVTAASERLTPLLRVWSVNKEYANNNDKDLDSKTGTVPSSLTKLFGTWKYDLSILMLAHQVP